MTNRTTPATFEEVVAALQSFAAANWPGAVPDQLKLSLYIGGVQVEKVLSLPTVLPSVSRPQPLLEEVDSDGINSTSQPEKIRAKKLRDKILQVLARASEPLSVSAIAQQAGREYTSHFRDIIRLMLEDGDISKTDNGLYVLADE